MITFQTSHLNRQIVQQEFVCDSVMASVSVRVCVCVCERLYVRVCECKVVDKKLRVHINPVSCGLNED